MAELTASVITLAHASLVAIEKTVKYIKEIRFINDLIKDLLSQLKDLHRLIKTVSSTYRRANTDEDNPSSRFVGRTISTCQERLKLLEPLVFELAKLESETFKQKFKLKWRTDKVRKDIEDIIKNIHCDMEFIRTGLSCWTLEEQKAIRRISEAMIERQAIPTRADLKEHDNGVFRRLGRTMSDGSTVFDDKPELDLRRASTSASAYSRHSISSTSSWAPATPSDRSNSVASIVAVGPYGEEETQEQFRYHLARCNSNDRHLENVRDILQQHLPDMMLARSKDTWERTPLHIAAQTGDVELGRVLVSFGADVNAKDSEPASVLDLAVAERHRNFVAFLLEHNVDDTAVLPRNLSKFKEMKRTILFHQRQAAARRHPV